MPAGFGAAFLLSQSPTDDRQGLLWALALLAVVPATGASMEATYAVCLDNCYG